MPFGQLETTEAAPSRYFLVQLYLVFKVWQVVKPPKYLADGVDKAPIGVWLAGLAGAYKALITFI